MDVTLTVTAEEAHAIVQVLGQLPTSSNAFPLMMKVKQQIETTLPQADAQ